MTDTTTLSGYLLDYYTALAEDMPNPRLRKHEREDTYICVIGNEPKIGKWKYAIAYSPTTNPALALPIINRIMRAGFNFGLIGFGERESIRCFCFSRNVSADSERSLEEAALRALVAWKFPDGLPEIVYESEK